MFTNPNLSFPPPLSSSRRSAMVLVHPSYAAHPPTLSNQYVTFLWLVLSHFPMSSNVVVGHPFIVLLLGFLYQLALTRIVIWIPFLPQWKLKSCSLGQQWYVCWGVSIFLLACSRFSFSCWRWFNAAGGHVFNKKFR